MVKTKKRGAKGKTGRTHVKLGKDLEKLVGAGVYSTWIQMLKQLVPHGRTERLSVLVAAMLQYAAQSSSSGRKKNPAWLLLQGMSDDPEMYDQDDEDEDYGMLESEGQDIMPLIHALFKDAGVRWKRTNARGQAYSIAEAAFEQFQRWDSMPWE